MTQALDGLDYIAKAIESTKRRTIEVKYHASDATAHVFDADPEQDNKPGKIIMFMDVVEPYDFSAPVDIDNLPF